MYIERLTSKIYRIHKPSIEFKKKYKQRWICSARMHLFVADALPASYDWAFTYDKYCTPKKAKQRKSLLTKMSNVPLNGKKIAFKIIAGTDLRLLSGKVFQLNEIPDINIRYFEELGLKDNKRTVEESLLHFFSHYNPYTVIDLGPITKDEDLQKPYNLKSCIIDYNYIGSDECGIIEKFNSIAMSRMITIHNNINDLVGRIKKECDRMKLSYKLKQGAITLKYSDLCKCEIEYTITDLIY